MRELVDHEGYVPRTCVWEITRGCDLACRHCGTDAGRPRAGELDTAEALRVVRELAELGTRLLTLSGGEPTRRADWPVIARAAVDAGMVVNLVTNGQGDGPALAVAARDAGLANVGVSLDGLRPTHDAIRAPGSFDRATATIAALARAAVWVDVMFTVNRRNLAELEDVYALAGALGARGLRVQLGKPMGRQTLRRDLTLAPKDLLDLLPRLGRLADQGGPRVLVGDSIGYYSDAERALRGPRSAQGHWTGCWAGCQAIGLQADGGVKGCLSLQPRAGEADPFLEGNVRDAPLRAIWERPGAFAYNRAFSPASLTGACGRCSHARLCRGGARCVAHAFTGDLGCDPMCHLAASKAAGAGARAFPANAAAAATAILMALGACGCGEGETLVAGGSATGAGGATGSGGGTTTTGGGGAGGATGAGGTTTSAGGAGGAGGTTTSAGGGGGAGGAPADAGPDAADASADGPDCTNVCCECDYGTPPPPECCP